MNNPNDENNPIYWSTQSEINFIRKELQTLPLRQYQQIFLVDKINRLQAYLDSCRYRRDWGQVNKDVVINTAKIELNNLYLRRQESPHS